ncbi:condensation domain-containing protein [Streptomyces sp. NPDC050619]|uniref:condensation domain-containing protein n=1 Tax=Streptomyces sp. NPDC050619 TaxID=3157214 RepID=UPI003437F90A
MTTKPAADRAPLTYGQLSVWRVMTDWPPDRWPETYLSTVVPVSPDCSLTSVTTALHTLCARHESLRTRFADTPHGPEQHIMPVADTVDVAVDERPGATRAEAEAAGRERAGQPIDREKDFARRFTVVTDGGRPAYAVIVVDHIVADGYGLARLRAEAAALMGADDPDGKRRLDETPPQPRDLARLQRSEAQRPRREAALGYWRGLLRTLPADLFPVPDRDGHHPGRIEAVLQSPGARAALGTAARRLGVPPQGVLLALTSLATAAVTGTGQVVHTLQSSNRFTTPWRTIVSSMNQYVPLPLEPGAVPFARYARHVHGAALKAYRFGTYDIDAVTDLVRTERGIVLGFDHFYNFMAHDVPTGPEESDPGPRRIEATRPYRQIGPRFDVKVRGGPDMPLVVRADPALLPQPGLHALLAWYDDELRRLAADGGTMTDALLATCRSALSAEAAR